MTSQVEPRSNLAWRAAGWAAGASAAVIAMALAWLAGEGPGAAALLGTSLAGLGVGLAATFKNRRLAATAEKLSGDLDVLSARLVRAEAALAAGAGAPTGERAGAGAAQAGVAEITAEIGVLGGIVRDLADTVAAQDRDLASLKQEVERVRTLASRAPAPPVPVGARAFASPVERPPEAPRNPVVPTLWPSPDLPAPPAMPPAREEVPAADEERRRRQAAIQEAFAADRIELHLQPIVSLPQRKVRLYEALARLRLKDDTLLAPAEFLPALERERALPDLDRKVLARSAAVVRHLAARGSETLVAVNLAPASIEASFLRAVGRLVDVHPDLAGRLVLEVPQRSWRNVDPEAAGTLAQLRDRGLAFACDRVTDLRLDPQLLAERGVRYAKLPADLLLGAEAGRGLDVAVRDLAAVLDRAGVRLVAERVEKEEEIPDLIDLDVPLAQGFAFAPPRAVRPEVLAGKDAAPPPAPPPPPAKAPVAAEERRPFRSFLRRAGPPGS